MGKQRILYDRARYQHNTGEERCQISPIALHTLPFAQRLNHFPLFGVEFHTT
jgi:hypothetical protein